MLCNTRELDGFTLAALDGDIGQVRGVYFDETRWVIRHLVVDAGSRAVFGTGFAAAQPVGDDHGPRSAHGSRP